MISCLCVDTGPDAAVQGLNFTNQVTGFLHYW